MRAITVKQPWAWTTAAGHRRIENRGWRPNVVGSRVAIHAGSMIVSDLPIVEASLQRHYGEPVPVPTTFEHQAVVALATLAKVLESRAEAEAFGQGAWWTGPIAFLWDDIVQLPRPVACSGALNFWRLPERIELAVLSQLG